MAETEKIKTLLKNISWFRVETRIKSRLATYWWSWDAKVKRTKTSSLWRLFERSKEDSYLKNGAVAAPKFILNERHGRNQKEIKHDVRRLHDFLASKTTKNCNSHTWSRDTKIKHTTSKTLGDVQKSKKEKRREYGAVVAEPETHERYAHVRNREETNTTNTIRYELWCRNPHNKLVFYASISGDARNKTLIRIIPRNSVRKRQPRREQIPHAPSGMNYGVEIRFEDWYVMQLWSGDAGNKTIFNKDI